MSSFVDIFTGLLEVFGRDEAVAFAVKSAGLEEDEDVWRSTEEGKHFKFDDKTGEIKAGFGGRFNGRKLGETWRNSGGGGKAASGGSAGGGNTPAVPKRRLGDWKSRLSNEDRKYVEWKLDGRTPGEFINEVGNNYTRRKVLDAIAGTTDWKERLISREFEGLEDQEKKDLNYLLDQFPWLEDVPKYAKIPSEDNLYAGLSSDCVRYYDALKAKSLGVEGIKVPEKPEALVRAMTKKPPLEVIASQDGGYVHTSTGDRHREAVRSYLQRKGALDGLPPEMAEHKAAILGSIDKMDDRIAELVEKTMQNASISWLDSTGTSNYSTQSGAIQLFTRDINGDPRTPDDIASMFWHEYGHFVDDAYRSKSGIEFYPEPLVAMIPHYGTTSAMSSVAKKQYVEAATKDLEGLLEAAGLGDRFGVRENKKWGHGKVEFFRKSDGRTLEYRTGDADISGDIADLQIAVSAALDNALGYEKYLNFMQEHGAPAEVKRSDYIEMYTTPKRKLIREREKFPGARDALREAYEKRNQEWDAWVESIGGQDAYFELSHERDALWKEFEDKKSKLGGITDCIDEATNGMLAMVCAWGGHYEDYYRERSNTMETSANIFSARARNDADEVAFMDKVIPNISKLFTQAWRADYE